MRFERVRLLAPRDRIDALGAFYAERLAFPRATRDGPDLIVPLGETTLVFSPADGEPFYHVAFLVPGDRFDAALAWARARTALLPSRHADDVVFDFRAWDALACYFHDPAGNIVELIAHRGVGEAGTGGEFSAAELVGMSEVGLVGDPAALVEPLARDVGLPVWDGSVEAGLAFAGERARTLILAREGRGWMPTGRPSEPHGVEVVIAGGGAGETAIGGGRYRVRRRPAAR